MPNVDEAIKIIQSRYDSLEYKRDIQNMTSDSQRIYGSIDKIHTFAVLDWVKKLYKNTPDALLIAAAGHDWDRAFEDERDKSENYPCENGKPLSEWYNIHKIIHSANTARLLRNKLSNILSKEIMLDVTYLVLNHEVGGQKDSKGNLLDLKDNSTNSYNLNEAAEILQQADSLSFFNILDIYVNWRSPDKVRQKIKYMYDRIQDAKIKEDIKNFKFKNPIATKIFKEVLKI